MTQDSTGGQPTTAVRAVEILAAGATDQDGSHTVTLRDTPAIRGMVEAVQHLVDVEVTKGSAPLFGLRHKNPDGSAKKKG